MTTTLFLCGRYIEKRMEYKGASCMKNFEVGRFLVLFESPFYNAMYSQTHTLFSFPMAYFA